MLSSCRNRHLSFTVLSLLALVSPAQSFAEENLPERDLYDRFMEDLFARPEEDASFLGSHELVVTVRVGGEFDPQVQVSVYREGPEVLADVVRTPGRPVHEQISRLRSRKGDDRREGLCPLYTSLVQKLRVEGKGLAVATRSLGDPLLMSYVDAVKARSERAWEGFPAGAESVGEEASEEEVGRFFEEEFLRNVRDHFEVFEDDHARWVARLLASVPTLEPSTVDDFVSRNVSTGSASLEGFLTSGESHEAPVFL